MARAKFFGVARATTALFFLASAACSDVTSPPAQSETAASAARLHDEQLFYDAVDFRPRSGRLTSSQSVRGIGDVGKTFSSVTRVCLVFKFSGDLLDHEDEVSIRVDGRDAGGFINPGPEPQASRKLCWVRRFHPEIIAKFLDGEANLRFIAVVGSVTIRSISLRILGIPR